MNVGGCTCTCFTTCIICFSELTNYIIHVSLALPRRHIVIVDLLDACHLVEVRPLSKCPVGRGAVLLEPVVQRLTDGHIGLIQQVKEVFLQKLQVPGNVKWRSYKNVGAYHSCAQDAGQAIDTPPARKRNVKVLSVLEGSILVNRH